MKNYLQIISKNVWKGKVMFTAFFLLASCLQYDESLAPRDRQQDLLLNNISLQSEVSLLMKRTFTVHLTGDNEVPANASQAQGEAIFRLNEDGTELYYKLIVANLENAAAAHIHCAAAGVNGPVLVPLFGTPTPGVSNGVLAEGTITSADVLPLDCIGGASSLDALLDLMRSGGAYVNVHTNQLKPGEIRGQI